MTEGNISQIRLLIVDDDPTQLLLLKTKLAKKGYVIETANNGTEALGKVYTFKPDVMLLDVHMPGLAGNEVIRTILVFRPEIEIIVLTASKEPELKEECLRKGAFSCIWKPVVFDDLCRTIQAAAEKGKERQPPSAAISDADMSEVELALKILEKQGVMSRSEALEELRKIRSPGY